MSQFMFPPPQFDCPPQRMALCELRLQVPGAQRYLVSEMGTVWACYWDSIGTESFLIPERQLKLRKNDEGYLKVKLVCDDGKRRDFFVHRLVLLAFRPEEYLEAPERKKLQACHRPGPNGERPDRTDNRLENLYWGTHAQNHADKVRAGTHRNGCVRKLSQRQVSAIRRSKKPVKLLAGKYGLSLSHVRAVKAGKRHNRGDYFVAEFRVRRNAWRLMKTTKAKSPRQKMRTKSKRSSR